MVRCAGYALTAADYQIVVLGCHRLLFEIGLDCRGPLFGSLGFRSMCSVCVLWTCHLNSVWRETRPGAKSTFLSDPFTLLNDPFTFVVIRLSILGHDLWKTISVSSGI